jgi:hypothetical protein
MAVKTQGTQLFFIDPDATGGPEVVAVECATSLSGLGAPREQIETTCLESDDREYVAGLSTPSQLTLNLNADFATESHFRLYELWKDGGNISFAIGLGSDPGVPTLDSNGDFDLPTTRTFVVFDGFIADFPIDLQLNAVVTAAITVQVSGGYTIFRKA